MDLVCCSNSGDRLTNLQSIEYGFAAYPALNDYIRDHSQEMSEAVMRKHIELYVNDHSLDLGSEGKAAILKLLEVYQGVHVVKPVLPGDLWI